MKEQDRKLILPLRRLLLMPHAGGPVDETELTYAELRKRVLDATADFNKARYTKLAADLPALTRSIEAAVGLHQDEAKENLYRLLAHANILAAQTLVLLRGEDLACEAIRRAMGAAENAGDPILRATAAELYTWAFMQQGLYEDAETIAVGITDELGEPSIAKATPAHLAIWGKTINEASRAATHNNRHDAAREFQSLARSVAVRLESGSLDYGKFWTIFNVSMAHITEAQNALVTGDATLSLRLGRKVQRTPDLHLDWWTDFLRTMAEAQTATRDYAAAIETMKSIRRIAPEWLKNQRTAHDVVITLLGKVGSRKAKSSGLAELAQFMGVQV